MLATLSLLYMVLIVTEIEFGSTLCSSYNYNDKVRSILSKQTNYTMYEGKLIFRQNATFITTNPSGIYGTPYFENIENITNPNSISPHSTYFLRSSNILILPMCTPPYSIYFSFVSYLMDRFNDYENNTFYENRKILFADLGATLNNLVWNTSSNMENMTNNYDSLTTVIQTGDNTTFNDIYNRLINGGISSHEINLQSLPNKYIKWLPYKYNNKNIKKYNITYDTGTFLLRVSLTKNKTQYEQYINTNQTIFLLQPKNVNPDDNQPKQPFDPFVRDTYSANNFNETSVYNNILNEYVNDLINYLEITYNLTYKESTRPIAVMYPDIGFSCIQDNVNCGGANRDALYYEINHTVSLYNNVFYVFVGVIHENYDIQQTIYSSVVYQNFDSNRDQNDNPSITNFEYNGSGLILPVKTNINKKYLQNIFVVQLTEPNLCINQLPGFCYIPDPINFGDAVIRNYLNPITKTRPDMTEIVVPILIKFQKSL